jgi:hypothetical protein
MPFREGNMTGFQWVIGYAYFGGLTNWNLGVNTFKSYSPIKLGNSKPHWVLAADTLIKLNAVDGVWYSERAETGTDRDRQVYNNIPPHATPKGNGVAGANHLFIDGSAGWRIPQKHPFYAFHRYSGIFGAGLVFWSQELQDIPATGGVFGGPSPLLNALNNLQLPQ